MDDIAPMIVMVTLILTTGGVLLLRPIARKLADYLEAATLEKRKQKAVPESAAPGDDLLESLDHRLQRLEERVHFTESLLTQQTKAELGTGRDAGGGAR